MSELQLSHQMIRAVQDVIVAEDSQAQDSGVTAQYLSAIIGVLLGSQDMPKATKKEILEQLYAFSEQVMADIEDQRKPAQPPAEEAFGIWRPGDD